MASLCSPSNFHRFPVDAMPTAFGCMSPIRHTVLQLAKPLPKDLELAHFHHLLPNNLQPKSLCLQPFCSLSLASRSSPGNLSKANPFDRGSHCKVLPTYTTYFCSSRLVGGHGQRPNLSCSSVYELYRNHHAPKHSLSTAVQAFVGKSTSIFQESRPLCIQNLRFNFRRSLRNDLGPVVCLLKAKTRTTKATRKTIVIEENESESASAIDVLQAGEEDVEQSDGFFAAFEMAELTADTIPLAESETPLTDAPLVIGIDPDLNGALAVLRPNSMGTLAEVVDVPCITVKVGKTMRRRHDAVSIAGILRQLEPPTGSMAYLEQPTPFPKDGKQGWYSSGFGYGVWIGILATLGFSIVPVPAATWKRALGLTGCLSPKDESRILAASIFPSVASKLKRKKDHGRAEALLIAAWGRGVRNNCALDEDRTRPLR